MKYWNTNSEVLDFPEAEERAELRILNYEIEVFWSPSVKHDPEHHLCLVKIGVLPLGYKVSPQSG